MMYTGLMDRGILYHQYEEEVRDGMRLGRHQKLDARSLAHMVENDVTAMSTPIDSQLFQRVIPILDQGSLGSCTGNAGTGALGTEPFYGKVGQSVLPPANDAVACETFAVTLYGEATTLDPFPGTYPPDDTGSSGMAICQALRNRGTIDGYRWARTAYGFLTLLQNGPVLQGMPWYRAFYEPDANGFIDADKNWRTSDVVGGHEVEAIGVEIDRRDVFDSVVLYANSWGTGYGDAGRFRMRLRTYEQLAGVDLKQYVI